MRPFTEIESDLIDAITEYESRPEFKKWTVTKTGLSWSTCRLLAGARAIFSGRTRGISEEEKRERRIAFVVDAAFYLDDDEWDEAHGLIIARRLERRRAQKVVA